MPSWWAAPSPAPRKRPARVTTVEWAHADLALRMATVRVHIPMLLRDRCGGAAEIPLAATSMRTLLGELERRHPGLYQGVCDETGTVRRHVNLFVNMDHMRDRNGL